MKLSLPASLTGLLFLLLALPAMALELSGNISTGLENRRGETAYEVAGLLNHTSGPPFTSELIFPLDGLYFTVRGDLHTGQKIFASITAKTNLTDDPGTMTDADWIYPGSALDIYSESASNLNAWIFRGQARYRFWESAPTKKHQIQWTLAGGLGLLYQRFDYEIYDTWQVYPASGAAGEFFPGKTLTYTVDYLLPYATIKGAFRIADKFRLETSLGYSPLALAWDEDHHLLRDRVSEGDYAGQAVLVDLAARYNWTRRIFSRLVLSHRQIRASGDSTTYENDRFSHTIDQDVYTTQSAVQLHLGYHF